MVMHCHPRKLKGDADEMAETHLLQDRQNLQPLG